MIFYRAISYIFHPILFSTIASFLYFIVIPRHIADENERIVLAIVFISTYIIPVLLVFFLKRFGLIVDYHLKTIGERKFPVLFMALLFFLLGKLLLDPGFVDLLAFSFFGCGIGLIMVYLLFPLKIKASLHTLSISGLIAFICIMSYQYELNLLILIISLFMLFGIIAVSRLKLDAHKNIEVYIGFLIGCISQLTAYTIFLNYHI
ncbi:MAG: hypothetical protein HKN90_01520 [Flavobacteriaceae bacterium]|nr:hypothetical protein [Flavobacteriaceae bacterium]